MKAIIVDDEKRSADNLRRLINENCPDVNITAVCHEATEGIKEILLHHPQIVFLDIEMPFLNGFQVRDGIKQVNPHVIFTTAFSEYAVKAFRANACDYLLKPIDPSELTDAVNKAKNSTPQHSEVLQRIEAIEKSLGRNRQQKLPIQSVEGYALVDFSEVIRLEASSNYTHIFCRPNKKYTVAKLLKDFEDQLSQEGFFRSHSSHLVNLAHVTKYLRGDGGYLFMSDGAQIEVSRSRKKELLKVLLGED